MIFKKKDKELKKLKSVKKPKREKKRNITLGIFVFCLILGGGIYFWKQQAITQTIFRAVAVFQKRPRLKKSDLEDFRIKIKEKTVLPDEVMHRFTSRVFDEGKALWKLEAQKVSFFREKQLLFGQISTLWIYRLDGSKIRIESLEMKAQVGQKRVRMQGKVRIFFPEGLVLQSEVAFYEGRDQLIWIPRQQLIHGWFQQEGKKIYTFAAYGMRYKLQLQELFLLRKVHLQMLREGVDHTLYVRSDQAHIWLLNHKIQFDMFPNHGVVRIWEKDFWIHGMWAVAQYGKEGKKGVEKIWVFEKVRFHEQSQGETHWGKSGEAFFHVKKDTVFLRKFPQLYTQHDTLIGEEIVLFRKQHIVEVRQSNALIQRKGI